MEEILNRFKKEFNQVSGLKGFDLLYRKYLGKKGEMASLLSTLKSFSLEEKKKKGKEFNFLKKEIENAFQEKKFKKVGKEGFLDITRKGGRVERGHLHLLTQVQREAAEIFQSMGFEVVQGPELETAWYNFDALNVPKDHPARDMQDTFWVDSKKGLLMRTQTSPMQVRYMEKNQPPLRIIVPGRVFRNEATDAFHEAQFYQLEGLMVDKHVSASHFKAIMQEFLERYFKTNVEVRLRPGYFPFVEPGFEMDAKRKGGKWLELMGAGMVHPNVFKAVGLNPKEWQGFAFGVGLERLAMIKYKVTDLRMFYQTDLRFLKQF